MKETLKEFEPKNNDCVFRRTNELGDSIDWTGYDRVFAARVQKVRSIIVDKMTQGEVLFSKDIQKLTEAEIPTRSTSWITQEMHGTKTQRRRIKGYPDFQVGSGKYRGRRIYFDASLEPDQIDFDGVIERIDAWKDQKNVG